MRAGRAASAARRGDRRALEALLLRHLPRLRAFLRLQVSPFLRAREADSDIVQSVCREVLEHLCRFEYRGDGSFRRWLYRFALNKIRSRSAVLPPREAGRPRGDRLPRPGFADPPAGVLHDRLHAD